MNEIRIIGLHITDRLKESDMTQAVLTRYSNLIKTRLGFHELSNEICSRTGVIVLQLTGSLSECDAFEKELFSIGGIEVKKMSFIK
jgi:hypothetical protein